MKGLFIPEITAEMFRNGCLESIEALMAEGEIYDIEYSRWIPVSERLPKKTGRYLCTVGAEYRNPREMYYAPQEWANKSDDATWRSIDGSYVYDWFVKAWMPLPEPYKETEE